MYTIKDLAEGRCAVINDGALEELREVLRMAFPEDEDKPGKSEFYYRNDDFHSEWQGDMLKPNLPTQSVKDFLKPSIQDKIEELKELAKSQGMECEVVVKERKRVKTKSVELRMERENNYDPLIIFKATVGSDVPFNFDAGLKDFLAKQLELYLNGEV